MAQNHDLQAQIARYNALVEQYQQLDRTIDGLIMANDGGTEQMSGEDFARYRDLARQRDDIFSEMRALEQELFDDES